MPDVLRSRLGAGALWLPRAALPCREDKDEQASERGRSGRPRNRLKILGRCPVCGEEGRSLFLDRLRDNTFYTAPGEWTLWRCEGCRALYLDPQPTAETIESRLSKLLHAWRRARPPAAARHPKRAAAGLRGELVGGLASDADPAYRERVPLPPTGPSDRGCSI